MLPYYSYSAVMRRTTGMMAEPILELRHASVVRGQSRAPRSVEPDHPSRRARRGIRRAERRRQVVADSTAHAGGLSPRQRGRSPTASSLRPDAMGRGRAGVARMGIVSADEDDRFTDGPWVGQVPALDVVLSGFFASRGVFQHHEVTEAMREQARDALIRVGALHLAAARLDRLSTGEARRVLIARALVRTPRCPGSSTNRPPAWTCWSATASWSRCATSHASTPRSCWRVTYSTSTRFSRRSGGSSSCVKAAVPSTMAPRTRCCAAARCRWHSAGRFA